MDGCGVGGRARRIGRIIRSARLSGLLVGIRRGHATVGDVLGPLGSVPVAVLMSAGGIRLPTCGVVGHLRWSCRGVSGGCLGQLPSDAGSISHSSPALSEAADRNSVVRERVCKYG